VLIGFLILPGLLWLKKYWVAAVVFVAVIFHSIALWPYLQGSRVMASLEEPEHLTLMFANIYYKSPDFKKIQDILHIEDPEVVFFAELPEKDYHALKALIEKEYPYSEYEEGQDAYDISYFSKHEPETIEIPEFSENDPSIYLKYNWEGKKLNILGMHPHSPMAAEATAARDKHLNAALEYASKLGSNTIILGDFNISQFSPKFPKLLEEYGLVDTQLEFGLQPSWHADKAPIFRIPIDQVLVSKDVEVYDRYLGQPTGSDHLPVIVKIEVQ
jgi:endonuclease/exonuclease/phosphatase (EEP) superfamily protein YafD